MIRAESLTRPQLCAAVATLAECMRALEQQAALLDAGDFTSSAAIERELAILESTLADRDTAPAAQADRSRRTAPRPPAPTRSFPRYLPRQAERIERAAMLRETAGLDLTEVAEVAPDLARELAAPRLGG